MDGDFTWRVKNFTQITESRIYSRDFEVGTYTWRMVVYPRGNGIHPGYVAVYLEFVEPNYVPTKYCPKAHFLLVAVNHLKKDQSVIRETAHAFSTKSRDWGFTKFLRLEDALNPESGFVEDDKLVLKVKISVRQEHVQTELGRFPNGFVGLKSEGSCCVNSIVQFLYHIPIFRKAVYRMTTQSVENRKNSIHSALQELFFKLQYQDTTVSTEELTRSLQFGHQSLWILNDMQKLRETFFTSLQKNMKGSPWETVIQELFVGYYSNRIECQNVDYKSSCKQPYVEIDLDVDNCKDVYESLELFCKAERLEGANKFDAERHGLQDAWRTARFDSFPPILQLQLKRLRYGPGRSDLIKNHVRYEFYDELDLDCNDRALLSESSESTVRNKYRLFSVFIHTGSADGGTYGLLIRSKGRWYRLQNELVTEEPPEAVLSEYSGGEERGIDLGPLFEFGNVIRPVACSLVYVRCSDWDRIMCECTKEDIEERVRRQFETELFEKTKRNEDKKEAHLSVVIKLVTDRHFADQTGSSQYFGLGDFNGVLEYRLHKNTSLEDFQMRINRDFGIPPGRQCFWLWRHRNNGTISIDKPLDCARYRIETVFDLKLYKEEASAPTAAENALMTILLFLETPGRSFTPILNQTLIFVKFYDPKIRMLSYIGHLFADKSLLFSMILEYAGTMAKLSREAVIVGFREVSYESTVVCRELMPSETPYMVKMVHGDIIIIQERVMDVQQVRDKICCPTAKSFLERIQDIRVVTFKRLEHATDDGFKLELMKTMTYEQVTAELARYLMLDDPLKIRLTQHDASAQLPCSSPIEYNGINTLEAMIARSGQHSNILYYELLDIQLPNLENARHVIVSFHNQKAEFQSQHRIQLQKDQTVGDLIQELRTELGEGYVKSDIRVMGVHSSRIVRVLDNHALLESVPGPNYTLRAEVIPKSETKLKRNEHLVHCCHCTPDLSPASLFGDPVWIRIKKGETLRVLKKRIQWKLEIPDEEFFPWEFAYHSQQTQQFDRLNDGDDIIAKFPKGLRSSRKNRKYVGDDGAFIALIHDTPTKTLSTLQ